MDVGVGDRLVVLSLPTISPSYFFFSSMHSPPTHFLPALEPLKLKKGKKDGRMWGKEGDYSANFKV